MNITKDKLSEYTVSGRFTVAASIKPFAGAKEQKNFTLAFTLDNVPVSTIIADAIESRKKINFVNGHRDKFNEIPDKGIVEVPYTGGRQAVDPEQAYFAKLDAMSPEEAEAELQAKIAQLRAKQTK